MARLPYRQLIGVLSYLAHTTRSDIANAVCILSQHCANPGLRHWTAAKRVLRYLKGTLDFGPVYRRTGQAIHFYCDASHASDASDRRSVSGVYAILAGAPVVWHSVKQKTVSLSSMESEYKSLSLTVREEMWIRNILTEVQFMTPEDPPVKIFCDSRPALDHAENYIENSRTRHLEIAHHFVRERVEADKIKLQYISTNENLADLLTKPLSGTKLRVALNKLFILGYQGRCEQERPVDKEYPQAEGEFDGSPIN